MLIIFILCPITLLIGLFSLVISIKAKMLRGCVFGVFLCIIGGICLTGILTEKHKGSVDTESSVVTGESVKYDWELEEDDEKDTTAQLNYGGSDAEGDVGEEGTPAFDYISDSEVLKYVIELEQNSVPMSFTDADKETPTTIELDGRNTTTKALLADIQEIREQHYNIHVSEFTVSFIINADAGHRYAVLQANADDIGEDDESLYEDKQNFRMYADVTDCNKTDKELVGHTIDFTINESDLKFVKNVEADESNYIEIGLSMSLPVFQIGKNTEVTIR